MDNRLSELDRDYIERGIADISNRRKTRNRGGRTRASRGRRRRIRDAMRRGQDRFPYNPYQPDNPFLPPTAGGVQVQGRGPGPPWAASRGQGGGGVTGLGNLGQLAQRPGLGNLFQLAQRPGLGNLGQLAQRPGLGTNLVQLAQRPQLEQRPGLGTNLVQLAQRPGLGTNIGLLQGGRQPNQGFAPSYNGFRNNRGGMHPGGIGSLSQFNTFGRSF